MKKCICILAVMIGFAALAQESPSFKLTDHVFNAGGHPRGGTILSSASYRITLDAIGEGAIGSGFNSASFRTDGGFSSAYPPPGETLGLWFADKQNLHWEPEKSVGIYNLYRDLMSNLAGLGYGDCHQQGIADETYADGDTPSDGEGYFYLVTAENRLGEEGTKGLDGAGTERPNPAPCP